MTLTSGNPMRVVLLAILIFEVAVGLAVGFGGGAALLALVAAAVLRRPAGYLIAWLVQLLGVGLGFLTASMFFVGAMFLTLWLVTFVLGKRLDRPAVA